MSKGKLIVVANQKGGVGKTTLTAALAEAFAAHARVLVADTDPQNSLVRAAGLASDARPFSAGLVSMAGLKGGIRNQLKSQLENYQIVLVDSPPSATSAETIAACGMADLLLVPFTPAPYDVLAMRDMLPLIEQVQAGNPDLKVLLVANMVQKNSIGADVLKAIAGFGYPLATTRIGARTAHKVAAAEGVSVVSLGGAKNRDAIVEVQALADEVINLLS